MTNALGRSSFSLCCATCARSTCTGLMTFSGPSNFESSSVMNSVDLPLSCFSANPTSRMLLCLERYSQSLLFSLSHLHSSTNSAHCFCTAHRHTSDVCASLFNRCHFSVIVVSVECNSEIVCVKVLNFSLTEAFIDC